MCKNDTTSLSIAYIIEKFPSPTEYFILNEILALEKYGVKIFILSIRKPKFNVQISELIDLKASVFYSSNASFSIQLLNFIKCTKKLPNILSKSLRFNAIFIFKQLRYLFFAFNFEKQLTNIKITNVHAHFAFIATDVGYELSRLLRVNFSFTAHAQDIFLNQLQILHKIKYAKFVITCTNYNLKYLNELTENKYKGKLYHVYHGIDLEKWRTRERNQETGDRRPEIRKLEPIKLLTVARLVEKKGIEYLISAIAKLKEDGYNIEANIIGEGPLRNDLEYFVEEVGLSSSVKFLGIKGRNEVFEFLSVADIFILPGIIASNGDMDGLPNVLLEAMVAGVPLISTDISAIPELIVNNHTGILIPEKDEKGIANAVLRLILDIKLYNSIVINARKIIQENFNIVDSTEKLIHMFREYAKN